MAYFLTERQSTATYLAAFKAFESTFGRIKPVVVMSDYEDAIRLAVKTFWPEADLRGCWFHYAQRVLRKAKLLKIAGARFSHAIQIAMSLPLLPEEYIEAGIQYVASLLSGPDCDQFVAYLRTQWLHSNISVFGQSSRTNNLAESFHRDMMRTFKTKKPMVWYFVHDLRTVNHKKACSFNRLENHKSKPRLKRRSLRVRDSFIEDSQTAFLSHKNVGEFLNKTHRIMGQVYSKAVRTLAAEKEEGPLFTENDFITSGDEDDEHQLSLTV